MDVEFYVVAIVLFAPQNSWFTIYDPFLSENISKENYEGFNTVADKVFDILIKLDFIDTDGKGRLRIIPELRDLKEKWTSEHKPDNSIVIQRSFFGSNSHIRNNIAAIPSPNQNQSKSGKLWELISNNKLISSLIVAVVLALLSYYFGISL